MTQNIIQIKPILNRQIPSPQLLYHSQSGNLKNKQTYKQGSFPSPLTYLQPKNYHFFKKQYVSPKNGIDQAIVYDMMEYITLLSDEQKRVVQQTNMLINQRILEPIYKICGYYSQLANHSGVLIQKMLKVHAKMATQMKKIPQKNQQQLNKRIYCHECKAEMVRNEIQKLKSDLQLRDFEDKYEFYKIDTLKLFEMRKLKNYSQMLVQSQLEEEVKNINTAEKSISLQQFEEILNLFGSDIHKKNVAIQSGIGQINQLCKKIDEDNTHSSVNESQLKEFEFFVGNREINKKLKVIFKRFYNKYNKIKAEKRRDAQTQANIKQSQVIRQLEKDKKELKLKLYKVEAQRAAQNQQHTKIIQELNIKVTAFTHQVEQKSSQSELKYLQYQRKLAEQRALVELLKEQIEKENVKYANLQMEYFLLLKEQRLSKTSSKKRTHSKRNTDVNLKKQNMSPQKQKKQKSMLAEDMDKPFTENAIHNQTSQNTIRSQKKLLNSFGKKDSRNTSIMSKRSLVGEVHEVETQKYGTYESIEQKRQEQQCDDMKRSKSNKLSRFRVFAGLSRFNNESEHTSPNASTKILSNKYMIRQNGQKDQQIISKQKSVRSSGHQSVSSYLYQNTLKKLYDYQTKRTSLQDLSFDDFAVNYEKFIKEINSQKQFGVRAQRESKEKNDSKEKRETTHLSLSRVQSLKDNSNANILKKRQTNKQSNQTKKGIKLQPLQRKSNYFLHKNKKNFSTYESKFAFSAFTSLQQSKIENKVRQSAEIQREQLQSQKMRLVQKIDKENILQPQHIINCFGGRQNIVRFNSLLCRNEQFVSNPQESQFIMNTMALLAQLHLNNPNSYQYIKKVIISPGLWTDCDVENNNSVERQASLQHALKMFLILHRDCSESNKHEKNRSCKHLQMLNSLIKNFFLEVTQSLCDQKIKEQNKCLEEIQQKKISEGFNQKYLINFILSQ